MKNLESLIKTYNDFPKKGIAFKDVLGIIQDTEVFRELILKMSSNKVIKSISCPHFSASSIKVSLIAALKLLLVL